jgi:uncharacterized integral membrane protein (TIGR00698 family)
MSSSTPPAAAQGEFMPVLARPMQKPGDFPDSSSRAQRLSATLWSYVPGVLLAAIVAGGAVLLRMVPGLSAFSSMILAILIGMILHNVIGTPAVTKPGLIFCVKRLLRFAIVLLGLQLTVMQLAVVGLGGVATIVIAVGATFVFTLWLGRVLGVDAKLSRLIAAGTSICGASAVVAANAVTEAREEDVSYAVACITLFGTIAMFAYPLLDTVFPMLPRFYGIWVGASVHEVAQVVAAAFQGGQSAGEIGTITKLGRVLMLLPVVAVLGVFTSRERQDEPTGQGAGTSRFPWFVVGFAMMIVVNSLIAIPSNISVPISTFTTFLLTMALAAVGLETNIKKLWAKGLRPLVLGLAASLFISATALILVETTTVLGL